MDAGGNEVVSEVEKKSWLSLGKRSEVIFREWALCIFIARAGGRIVDWPGRGWSCALGRRSLCRGRSFYLSQGGTLGSD